MNRGQISSCLGDVPFKSLILAGDKRSLRLRTERIIGEGCSVSENVLNSESSSKSVEISL